MNVFVQLDVPFLPVYVNTSRVAKFCELSINSLVFQKPWLEDSEYSTYSFLILGILQSAICKYNSESL